MVKNPKDFLTMSSNNDDPKIMARNLSKISTTTPSPFSPHCPLPIALPLA